MIKVSVLIATLDEQAHLPRCLAALKDFDDVHIVDSGSTDETVKIADQCNVPVHPFKWNGQYPKKRQWILENIQTKYDYIFFYDADEEVTDEFISEIKNLSFDAAGYFVSGQYVWQNKNLRYGLKNNKLALFHKNKFEFPIIDDLDDFCMGEMEGHYQPVLKAEYSMEKIRKIDSSLRHFSCEDWEGWLRRHKRYALWEAGMIRRNAYPVENIRMRQMLKIVFRHLPARGLVAFVHSYILKLGFLDGRAGFDFAVSRYRYYRMVNDALKTNR